MEPWNFHHWGSIMPRTAGEIVLSCGVCCVCQSFGVLSFSLHCFVSCVYLVAQPLLLFPVPLFCSYDIRDEPTAVQSLLNSRYGVSYGELAALRRLHLRWPIHTAPTSTQYTRPIIPSLWLSLPPRSSRIVRSCTPKMP